jgi:hypothetical protein
MHSDGEETGADELLELGRARGDYPLFCLVLYGAGPGLNKKLATYLRECFREVEDISGKNCLLVTLDDVRGLVPPTLGFQPTPGVIYHLTSATALGSQDPLDPYAVASSLGVPPTRLPCFVFFERTRSAFLSVSLSDLVTGEADDAAIHEAMAGLLECAGLVAAKDPKKRIRSLGREVARRFRRRPRLMLGDFVSEVVRGLAKAILDRA